MAGSVNKVILIGNLGKDPEIRTLNNGTQVTTIPIATSESYRDKTTGEQRDITDWHNVVLWRGLAEIAGKYLRKGSKVYIEGKLKNRTWEDQEGNTRYATEVVADVMTMLDRPGEGRQADNPASAAPKPMENMDDVSSNDEKDDLPF